MRRFLLPRSKRVPTIIVAKISQKEINDLALMMRSVLGGLSKTANNHRKKNTASRYTGTLSYGNVIETITSTIGSIMTGMVR